MDAFEALKALAIQGPMLANTLESALKTGGFAEDPGLKKALKIAKKLNGELQDFIVKMPSMPDHVILVEVKKAIHKFKEGTDELKELLRGHAEKN